MSFGPHPNVLIMIAEERCADLHSEVDQLRLLRLAQANADRRRPWSVLPAPKAVAAVLALLAEFQSDSWMTNRHRSSLERWENDAPPFGWKGGELAQHVMNQSPGAGQ